MTKKEEKKTTSEKPVSLSPLNFKEALEALLKVKPKNDKSTNGKVDKNPDN